MVFYKRSLGSRACVVLPGGHLIARLCTFAQRKQSRFPLPVALRILFNLLAPWALLSCYLPIPTCPLYRVCAISRVLQEELAGEGNSCRLFLDRSKTASLRPQVAVSENVVLKEILYMTLNSPVRDCPWARHGGPQHFRGRDKQISVVEVSLVYVELQASSSQADSQAGGREGGKQEVPGSNIIPWAPFAVNSLPRWEVLPRYCSRVSARMCESGRPCSKKA